MKKILTLLLVFAACGEALACDVNEPRCKASHELVEVLKYKDDIVSMQMSCRGNATAMNPEKLYEATPSTFMGIKKGSPSWNELFNVYEMYVEEACGDVELMYMLLAGYRKAWDIALPGDSMFEGLKKAKEEGRAGLQEEANFVRDRMNETLGVFLENMVEVAISNYDAKIKAVVSGEALDVADKNTMCFPTKSIQD